ncbi:MAG TPA: neutral zinc metallopeptidase [Acidobacteriaceae bacterium]|nr:neutral zinc metallopeptidase [Acidobacteriaceae bacterium]
MDWQSGGMSSDIEDRRGDSGGGGFGIGGGGGLGIVGFLVLLVISLITGHNFLGAFFGSGAPTQQVQQQTPGEPVQQSAAEDRDAHLISFTLDDVQKTWTQIFQQKGWPPYRHAKLVLFRGATYSGCGTAQAATGPFYCPNDQKVYIDLDFWDELRKFGGSTADFAQAYVIAHELGHHVQNLIGTEQKVQQLDQQEPSQRLHLSVDTELQADCYAGVWGHSAQERGIVQAGDEDAALSAAAAVGDDHLQKMAGRAVSPETWTHGSSQQRDMWFKRGFDSGDPSACNTFGGSQPD